MKNNKWVGDYQNNCVKSLDVYLKEHKDIDFNDVEYYQGTYNNACKFFGINGEQSKTRSGQNVDINTKIKRLIVYAQKVQLNLKLVTKTSAELYELLMRKTTEQYYFISDNKEEIIYTVISTIYDEYIKVIDLEQLSVNNKRSQKLLYFFKKHPEYNNLLYQNRG